HVRSTTNTVAGTTAMSRNTRRPSSLVSRGVRSATAAKTARLAIIHSPRARYVPCEPVYRAAEGHDRRVVCSGRNRKTAADAASGTFPAASAAVVVLRI